MCDTSEVIAAIVAEMRTLLSQGVQAGKYDDHIDAWADRLEATLPAAEPADAGRDAVAVPREVFDWLMGENGTFECDPAHYFRGRAPAYWWRSELLRRIASQQAVKP